MDDQVYEQQTGVEETAVAEQHTEVPAIETQTNNVPSDTGVEDSPAAEVKDEKDFAKALSAREEKIRQKLEKEYQERYTGYDDYKKQSELALRTARMYGFNNVADFEAAVEQEEQNRQIQAEAQRLGVDESVIREQLFPLNEKLSAYEKELQELKHAESLRQVEAKITAMEQDTVNFPGFADHRQEVVDIAVERGYTLEDAYKLFAFDNQKLLDTVRQRAEQETIRKIQQNADGSPGSLGADAPEQASGYLGMSESERKAYRERVKAGQA